MSAVGEHPPDLGITEEMLQSSTGDTPAHRSIAIKRVAWIVGVIVCARQLDAGQSWLKRMFLEA
jgi:hypothetical protein